MLIHIYTSEDRIKEIAFNIDPDVLNETSITSEKSISISSEIKGGLPKWLGFLGIQGEGSIGADGDLSISKESIRKEIDLYILSVVKKHIISNTYIHINNKTNVNEIDFNERIVRVQGHFSPIVSGSSGIEKITEFEKAPYLEWQGQFNKRTIKFGTTKDNYQNRTLIYQYLMNEGIDNYFDLFAITIKVNEKEIHLLPLFFGIELKI